MEASSDIDGTPASARQWAEQLARWAIPDEIRAAAPETPHGFDVGTFARLADEAGKQDTPSLRAARDALPAGGSVLDVGCGGGAGSLPLAPPAGLLVGFDEGEGMLAAFAERAQARGVNHTEIQGRWPDAAEQAPMVDVVVSHNVLYNVPDIVPFVQALTGHARERVVVQISEQHPVSWLNPFWEHLHGLQRPEGPTAEDAVEVVRDLGYDVHVERWEREGRVQRSDDELIDMARRRLCLGPEREQEVRDLFARFPPPGMRTAVTMWWPAL